MSEAVDTRVVEAKFDSKQFEQGVDRTVKKLDELKESLQMEDSGKSIAQMTEKASNALEQLENRFTSFAGILKNKILSGIADEITNVFFKLKSSVEGFIRSISSDQIGVGMSKYEQMLTSVRTMISAGETEASAYKAIETLGAYADQTSYSLDQMTSALSQMRAAGVDIKDGTKAVEGIANACAAAGVNATDASRAFYNLSQAYSSGALKYTDYRSLELLNMTTEKFKENMLEAAAEAGTLKKVSDGVYQTINTNDKKVSAGKKITVQNINDALKYNFMNKEAMNMLFGKQFFFDEENLEEIMSELGIKKGDMEGRAKALEVAKERFGEIAVNAYTAAREARSFTDVLSTIKDVVSRGWAKSFEWIFGALGDATEFFTWLTESNLAEFIYSIGDFRNGVLEAWSESGGRDDLVEGLQNIDELIGDILRKLGIFIDDEDDMETKSRQVGLRLSEATRNFKEFTEHLQEWFNDDRMNRIKRVFDTISNLFSTLFKAIGIAFSFLKGAFIVIEPLLGTIIDNIDKILSKINSIFNAKSDNGTKDGLTVISNGLDNVLQAVQPLIKPLQEVINFIGDLGVFIADFSIGSFIAQIEMFSSALGFVLELFTGKSAQKDPEAAKQMEILDKKYREGTISLSEYSKALDELSGNIGVLGELKRFIIGIGATFKDAKKFMSDFFKNLISDIQLIFGLREAEEGEDGNFFTHIKDYFDGNEFVESVKTKVTKALDDIKGFLADLPSKIGNIWNTIDEFLFGKKVEVVNKDPETNTITRNTVRVKNGFSKWLDLAIQDVNKWITKKLPKKVRELYNAVDDFLFGRKVNVVNKDPNNKKNTVRVKEGFSKWLSDTVESVKDWVVKELPARIKDLWNTIDEFLFGRKVNVVNKDPNNKDSTVRVKEGFSAWLDQAIEEVKNWILTIPDKIKDLWHSIIDFIFYRAPMEGEINPDTNKEYAPTDRVKNNFRLWLEGLPQKILDFVTKDFPSIIGTLWKKVIDFIFGPEVSEKTLADHVINPDTGEEYRPNERVKTGFSKWLENLPTLVGEWITVDFPRIIKDLWKKVVDFVFGPEVTEKTLADHVINPDTGEEYKPNERIKTGFIKWIENLPKLVGDWMTGEFPRIIKDLWKNVVDFIFGPKVTEQQLAEHTINPDTGEEYKPNERVKTGFIKWLENLPILVGDWITNEFPQLVKNIWNKVLEFVLGRPADPGEINPDTNEEYGPTARVKEGFSKWLDDVVQTVKNWIKTVPGKISEIWNTILGAIFGNDSGKKIKSVEFDETVYEELFKKDSTGVLAQRYEQRMQRAKKNTSPILSAVQDFVDALGIDIGKIISELPSKIIDGLTFGLDLIDILFKNANEWLARVNGKEISEELADDISASNEDISPLRKSLNTFGENVKELFTSTLPAFITEAFTWIGSKASGIWEGLSAAFTGEEATSEIGIAVENLALKIRGAIENIPSYLVTAFEWIKNLFTKKKVSISPEEMLDFRTRRPWMQNSQFNSNTGFKENLEKLKEGMTKDVKDTQYDFFNDYVAEADPFNFGEWIAEMGKTIVEVIGSLGPFVLDGINTIFELIGDGISWITDVFNNKEEGESIPEAVIRTLGGDDENAKKFGGLVDGLTKVGETIKNLIENIIPEFIKSGIKVLMDEAPKLISSGIGKIFGDGGDVQEQVTESGEQAIKGLENILLEVENEVEAPVTEDQRGRVSREGYIKELEARRKEVAVTSAEYEELSKRIKQLSQMKSQYIKIVDKDARIEELKKLKDEKWDTMTAVENDLRKNIFDTSSYKDNPKWLRANADYEEVKQELKYLEDLKDDEIFAFVDADAVEDFQTSTDNILDIFSTLSRFGASKTAATIGVIASLAWLISSLKDLFSQRDELKAEANKQKWTALTIAFSGIALIMGYVTYLAAQDDQTKVNNVLNMFDRMVTVVESLARVYEVAKGFQIVGGVVDIFKNFGDKNGDKWWQKILGKQFNLFLGSANTVVGIEMFGSAFVETFDIMRDIFTDVGSAIDELMTTLTPAIDKLTGIQDKIGDAIDTMGKVFELIHLLCYGIGITKVPLSESSGIASTTMELMDASAVNFSLIDEFEERVEYISSISLLMNSLAESLKTMQDVQSPAEQVQKMLGTVKDTNFGELIKQLYTVIFKDLFDPEAGFMYAEGVGRVDYQSAVAGFQILGEALNIFGKGFEGLSTDNVEALSKAIGVLAQIATTVYEDAPGKQAAFAKLFSGDKSLSAFASQVRRFGVRMKGFFEDIQDLPGTEDDSKYRKTKHSLELIGQISKDMVQVFRDISRVSLDEGTLNAAIGVFNSDEFISFASNVGSLFSAINTRIGESVPPEKIETIASVMNAISSIMDALTKDISGSQIDRIPRAIRVFKGDNFTELISGIGFFISDVNNNIGEGISISRIHAIVDGISAVGNIIVEMMENPLRTDALDNLERFFQILNTDEAVQFRDTAGIMTSLLTAINETDLGDEDFVSPKITPVLEITDEFVSKVNQIRSMFGVASVGLDNGQVVLPENMTSDLLSTIDIPTPISYTDELNDIKAQLTNIEINTNSFTNSLRNTRFIIQGREFADTIGPDIDEWLGMEGVYVARNNGTG